MKIITLSFFILFSFSTFGQLSLCPPAVQYDYDAAGNRIARDSFGPCKTDGSDTVTTGNNNEQLLSQQNDNRNLPLEEQQGFNISVYPNPTHGQLQVAAEQGFMGLGNKIAGVYSLKGELIFQQNITSSNFTLDFTERATGYYIVRVLADGYSKEWKIQKQ